MSMSILNYFSFTEYSIVVLARWRFTHIRTPGSIHFFTLPLRFVFAPSKLCILVISTTNEFSPFIQNLIPRNQGEPVISVTLVR